MCDRAVLEEAKTHLPAYLSHIGLDPSKNMKCLHHHPDIHPSMSLLPDHTHVYCHACNWQADLINVIAEVEHLEPNSKDAIKRTIEFAGIDPISRLTVVKPKNTSEAPETHHKRSWTPALKSKVCMDYLQQRGFSSVDKDLIIEYNIAFDKKTNCLIIPHDGDFFTARTIGNVDKGARYSHNPATAVTLFNGNIIDSEPVIAVTEGALDALSLICCGMPAVATGGAQTQAKLIKALQAVKPTPNIIIAFDDDVAGNNAAYKLVDKINKEFKTPYARLDLRGASDVNELFASNRDQLKAAIRDALIALNNFVMPLPIAHALKRDDITMSIKQVAQKLICNRFGYPSKIAANFDTIFEHDPVAKNLVAFNELSNRIELTRRPSWRRSFQPNTPWQDCDDNALQNYIDRTYEFRAPSVFLSVINEYAYRRAFHPVQDFFRALPTWDQTPRAESLLIDNLGADDTPYTRAITKQWLIAAVSRIFNPGCKFDYCLVLKGKQGIGKSTLLQKLGGAWFGELNSIQGKDAVGDLQGLWIVELVEMQATQRADNEQIKSFLSTTKDRARLSYDRRTSEFPRQCVFAATTNEHDFLRDQTGGRRFWIAELHSEHYSLRADLDPIQIWAEVFHFYNELFANGFNSSLLDLDNSLKPVATELQAKNTDGADLRGRIEAFLERPIPINDLWQLLSQEERRQYFKFGNFNLPFARVEQRLQKHNDFNSWKNMTKKDVDGKLFLSLTFDINNPIKRHFIFGSDPRRHLISAVELANELFYDDKLAVSNRRIADIMRNVEGWQQSKKQPRDRAYGAQKTVFERIKAD